VECTAYKVEITNLLDERQTRVHSHLDTDDIPWDRDITG
jgi:hypothetical protein